MEVLSNMARINVLKSKDIITIGLRVEVVLANDQTGKSYSSRIEDFNDKELVIAMPMDQGYPIIPITGETLYIKFHKAEAMFRFATVFIDKASTPIPILRVVMPQEVERYQQREFVRVHAMIPLKVQQEDDDEQLLPVYHTHSSDISGGGIRLIFNSNLLVGSRLHIETSCLPKVGVLKVCCKVIRVEKISDEDNLYSIGTKFIDLPRNTQQRLIGFIFQKQRELLAKRLSD